MFTRVLQFAALLLCCSSLLCEAMLKRKNDLPILSMLQGIENNLGDDLALAAVNKDDITRMIVEEGSRTVKCYYCNAVILPPCLHIIHNLDGHERREEEKTIHKDCLRQYLHLRNWATATVKRYRAGFALYGRLPGRKMDNREYNMIYHSELKG